MPVHSEAWEDAYVQVDGTAEIIDMPEAVEPLGGYFRCISGEHPDWDDYRAAMRRQNKSQTRSTSSDGARWGRLPARARRRVSAVRTVLLTTVAGERSRVLRPKPRRTHEVRSG